MSFQSGGSFLPNQEASITSTVPWNFVVPPTTGGSGTVAGTSSLVGTTNTQTISNKSLSGPLNDTSGVNRLVLNPTPKAIVDASATSLFDVACPASASCGGFIIYHVFDTDGTDFQGLTGIVTYAAVNKAASLTLVITELATTQAKAVSSGTLTLAWTFVTGTNKGTVKLQPTGSLTETTFQVTYTVIPIVGAITLL